MELLQYHLKVKDLKNSDFFKVKPAFYACGFFFFPSSKLLLFAFIYMASGSIVQAHPLAEKEWIQAENFLKN